MAKFLFSVVITDQTTPFPFFSAAA